MKKTSPRNKDRGVAEVEKEIKDLLARNPHLTFKKRQLAKVLGYTTEHEYARFKQALRNLENSGEIRQTARRKFGTSKIVDDEEASTAIDDSGYAASVKPEGKSTRKNRKSGVTTGAESEHVSPYKPRTSSGRKQETKSEASKRSAYETSLDTEEATRKVVGRIERVGSSFKLLLRDRNLPTSLDISRKKLNGAHEGEKVFARIGLDKYRNYVPEVIEIFGEAGDPEVELRTITSQFDLRKDFPREVMAETESIEDQIPEAELAHRADFRDQYVFTIDPQDAKDFDDAVSLRRIEGDLFELGVHIADVSHYVREGSMLDVEAYRRGTSVYLTNGVIPMLPEKLSNQICSLNPDVDRLTYSVIMKIRSTGKVEDYGFAKSVIRSKRRFTYEEVQRIIESGKGDYSQQLLEMDRLAKTLNRLRTRGGSIDFDLPEAKFVFDELGRPVEIVKKMRLDSHRLVEEFMLLANKTVAAHIGKHGVRAKPFLYRVHDAPDPDKIRELAVFVSHFGYSLNYDGTVGQKQLQRLIASAEGKSEEYIINDMLLRSMAKAIYSEKNVGHYGLAFKYYTHFTSPIRRYPDMIVHRLLFDYERGKQIQDFGAVKKKVADVSKTSSEAERRALEAERESVKIKQVQYMMDHLGDEFNGTISGITNFGMFVEIDDLLVEGLVHVREMDDYYTFLADRLQLKGRRTGKAHQLGDRVCVKVLRVNMDRREIDFVLCS